MLLLPPPSTAHQRFLLPDWSAYRRPSGGRRHCWVRHQWAQCVSAVAIAAVCICLPTAMPPGASTLHFSGFVSSAAPLLVPPAAARGPDCVRRCCRRHWPANHRHRPSASTHVRPAAPLLGPPASGLDCLRCGCRRPWRASPHAPSGSAAAPRLQQKRALAGFRVAAMNRLCKRVNSSFWRASPPAPYTSAASGRRRRPRILCSVMPSSTTV